MSIRRKARELALQCLYQQEMLGLDAKQSFDKLCAHFEVNKKAVPYALKIIDGVNSHLNEINTLINEHAKNWRLGRMAVIDRNIIRIAVLEFCINNDVPASVAINEALDIAKRYSSPDAASFINGVLDAIKNHEKKKVG